MLSHARAICNRTRELLEWAAQETLDVRLLLWRARGDRSPRATPGERAARAWALGCHCSCLSLSLCRQSLRLCRRSSLISAEWLVSAFCSCLWSGLCSRLCRRSVLVSAMLLSHLCLGYASRSSRATSTNVWF